MLQDLQKMLTFALEFLQNPKVSCGGTSIFHFHCAIMILVHQSLPVSRCSQRVAACDLATFPQLFSSVAVIAFLSFPLKLISILFASFSFMQVEGGHRHTCTLLWMGK